METAFGSVRSVGPCIRRRTRGFPAQFRKQQDMNDQASDIRLTMVLCAYGDNPFLEEAARSLVAQTVPVRLVIATSTPSDYIEGVAKKYSAGYRVNPERGGGIGADWEFAASCADTPFVTIAHQDDVYFPEYAEEVLKAYEKAPDSLIVFTDQSDLVNGEFQAGRGYLRIKRLLLWPFFLKRSWRLKCVKRLTVCFGNAICCPSVTYNIKRIGRLSFDRSFASNLDWQKWIDLARTDGAFTYIPKCLMAHRIDAGTTTSELIQSHGRYDEDLRIFTGLWGRTIARILMCFYTRSYKMADAGRK